MQPANSILNTGLCQFSLFGDAISIMQRVGLFFF